MGNTVFLIIMIPLASFFTGLGVFAWRRKKPMWFWSGSEVKEREIADIPAYNRANGIMWLAFSGVFWLAAVLGAFHAEAGGILLGVGCIGGVPALIFAYNMIYKKYRRRR